MRPTQNEDSPPYRPIFGHLRLHITAHSHRDVVRRIRNELERCGCNPLLFFLKCLEADDARLPELIRDEIKARTLFALCNTRASRRSKWVKQEIELVKQVTKRPRRTVVVMNLERDLQTELHKLDRLSKRAARHRLSLSRAARPENRGADSARVAEPRLFCLVRLSGQAGTGLVLRSPFRH